MRVRPSTPRTAGARFLALLVALNGVGVLEGGCRREAPNSGGGTARTAGASPIEIYTWWNKLGAIDPVAGLAEVHRRHHPDDLIMDAVSGIDRSGLTRKALHARMMANDPPDTFEANAGHDLLQWVEMNGDDASRSKLAALDDLVAGVADWRRAVPKPIVDQVSYRGKTYGVPVNIYRLNTVFYSKSVFERFHLTEPKSPDDFAAMEEKLRGSGIPLFAVGSREPWTLALIAFECLLVAREGPSFYVDYFHGQVAPDEARVRRTLEKTLELGRLFNGDHERLSWSDAIELVVSGRAAMSIMGDWARTIFEGRGLKVEVDFGQIPFPGTSDTFVFTSDAFALPVAARNPAGARRLLASMGTREAQAAMNQPRGSLSARRDVPAPGQAAISLANHELLDRGALVLALSGLVSPVFENDVAESLAEMFAEDDVAPVLQTLRSRQILLH
jgi:glucose/mannose transport system substrate-binding protein